LRLVVRATWQKDARSKQQGKREQSAGHPGRKRFVHSLRVPS
jgi:hypothetical protein